jgi:HSP20 family protein
MQMTLVRWDPSRELDTLQTEVNRIFDTFFGSSSAARGSEARTRRWVPAMDLVETENHLVLRADLPGMKREDVEIEVKDGVLTISGERKAGQEERSEGFYRVERAFGAFSRSLTLPKDADPQQVEADFEDGVLEVRIPKPEEAKPVRVAIGAGSVNGSATEK